MCSWNIDVFVILPFVQQFRQSYLIKHWIWNMTVWNLKAQARSFVILCKSSLSHYERNAKHCEEIMFSCCFLDDWLCAVSWVISTPHWAPWTVTWTAEGATPLHPWLTSPAHLSKWLSDSWTTSGAEQGDSKANREGENVLQAFWRLLACWCNFMVCLSQTACPRYSLLMRGATRG